MIYVSIVALWIIGASALLSRFMAGSNVTAQEASMLMVVAVAAFASAGALS